MQAGLPPDMDGGFYVDLTREVKRAFPDLHLHAFSPEEVLYGATPAGTTIRDFLGSLKSAGLGSLPGTSAEILDQEIRDVISPGRITSSNGLMSSQPPMVLEFPRLRPSCTDISKRPSTGSST